MLSYKHKKRNQCQAKASRFLISINVLGSAGPIRFVVKEDDIVAYVIDVVLKSYAREGRLPRLGSDLNNFFLYCPNAAQDALSPGETIGSCGTRNFMLCKKTQLENVSNGHRKSGGSWKAWINKSFNFKVSSE